MEIPHVRAVAERACELGLVEYVVSFTRRASIRPFLSRNGMGPRGSATGWEVDVCESAGLLTVVARVPVEGFANGD